MKKSHTIFCTEALAGLMLDTKRAHSIFGDRSPGMAGSPSVTLC